MSTRRTVYVGTFPDGSQIMVNRWLNNVGSELRAEAATRPSPGATWGPPIPLDPEDVA